MVPAGEDPGLNAFELLEFHIKGVVPKVNLAKDGTFIAFARWNSQITSLCIASGRILPSQVLRSLKTITGRETGHNYSYTLSTRVSATFVSNHLCDCLYQADGHHYHLLASQLQRSFLLG